MAADTSKSYRSTRRSSKATSFEKNARGRTASPRIVATQNAADRALIVPTSPNPGLGVGKGKSRSTVY